MAATPIVAFIVSTVLTVASAAAFVETLYLGNSSQTSRQSQILFQGSPQSLQTTNMDTYFKHHDDKDWSKSKLVDAIPLDVPDNLGLENRKRILLDLFEDNDGHPGNLSLYDIVILKKRIYAAKQIYAHDTNDIAAYYQRVYTAVDATYKFKDGLTTWISRDAILTAIRSS